MAGVVALLTDFGTQDAYVGIMKGVMRGICPTAEFIDISHAVRPQAVREAAVMLLNAYRYFPPVTVFLVVVDPGVGSTRRAIAVSAGQYHFVAPDNGVLSYVLADLDQTQAVSLTNPDYHLQQVSHTFHGRDIFAPAAGHIAAGVSLDALGETISDLQRLDVPLMRVSEDRLIGEVMHIDHFGNVISSLGEFTFNGADGLHLSARFEHWPEPRNFSKDRLAIQIGNYTIRGLGHRYSEQPPGVLLMLLDSNGFLEIAMNQGSAAAVLGLSVGDQIEVLI